mmetsp:Transcript_21652/g.31611  ORF Transcript_21652/g.31611 Transcript_21652/m.31611 type:complete len:365 (+) Transcript_21652:36-1130(+)|eukprot:CAMPEP_0197236110 /NCGR_PEP_ID=MMETSP1429-20130617/3353_1 /TAXON_ID=49237 /ORGANISM="Chaetoceros  sp., Strain UNC1202" /LENGTH=364 /DNA_ID=CAMNT_0042694855 /DNA_START=36 /DNA_END=1130 /DNA_ORIENTATION=+
MRFYATTLAAVVAFSSPQVILSSDEEVIDGYKVAKYPIENVLQEMLLPPVTAPGIGDIPAHLQYIVGLDQSGAVDTGTRMNLADPEYAATLSSGEFKPSDDGGFADQEINRCYNQNGGGWSMLDIESFTPSNSGGGFFAKFMSRSDSTLSNSGRGFFSKINGNDDLCTLTFKWNKDSTEAKIDGYFNALVGDSLGGFADEATRVSIELRPYWKWKFGIAMEKSMEKNAAKLDMKCCPPSDIGSSQCLGAATLGKEGSPCETISMACGKIKKKHAGKCAMYERVNKLGGIVPIPGFSGYLAYPLADRYGNPTPYNEFYFDAIKAKGVETLFHGIAPVGSESNKNDDGSESNKKNDGSESNKNEEL